MNSANNIRVVVTKAVLWVLVGIPVVFLGVLALFPVIGLSVNIVTLTGMVAVLGMVVDGAIIVAEHSTREPLDSDLPFLVLADQRKYGKTLVSFLTYMV